MQEERLFHGKNLYYFRILKMVSVPKSAFFEEISIFLVIFDHEIAFNVWFTPCKTLRKIV